MADEGDGNRELFDHLIDEFGDRGLDAVAFLETAQGLIDDADRAELPRQAGAAAYCVREALKRFLPPLSGRPSWRKLSDELLEAHRRFVAVRGLPGADDSGALDDLLDAIGQVKEFKEEEQGIHSRIAEVALSAMKSSREEPSLAESRRRLAATLIDLGYFEADNL